MIAKSKQNCQILCYNQEVRNITKMYYLPAACKDTGVLLWRSNR